MNNTQSTALHAAIHTPSHHKAHRSQGRKHVLTEIHSGRALAERF